MMLNIKIYTRFLQMALILMIASLFIQAGRSFVFADESNISATADTAPAYILYVSKTCPHCKAVEEWIREHSLERKVEYKEVYDNPDNQEEMVREQRKRNVPQNQVGSVPFMPVGDSDYRSGDAPIISYIADQEGLDAGKWKVENVDNAGAVQTEQGQSLGDVIILVLGGTVLAVIAGYGIYKSFRSDM